MFVFADNVTLCIIVLLRIIRWFSTGGVQIRVKVSKTNNGKGKLDHKELSQYMHIIHFHFSIRHVNCSIYCFQTSTTYLCSSCKTIFLGDIFVKFEKSKVPLGKLWQLMALFATALGTYFSHARLKSHLLEWKR